MLKNVLNYEVFINKYNIKNEVLKCIRFQNDTQNFLMLTDSIFSPEKTKLHNTELRINFL